MKHCEAQITAIIPVYNVSQYVGECVSSVLNQSYQDFRIIIINDGSTDDSWEKVLQLIRGDKRVTLVSKTNNGLGPTRNLGIRLAETEYVTFLDSDDWWDENYIAAMQEGIQKGKNDLVLADLFYVDGRENGKYICKPSHLRLPRGNVLLPKKNLLSRARNFGWGKTFRRSLFIEQNAWFAPHPYEDVSVVPFLTASAKSIYSIGKPLLYYRRTRQGSIRNDLSTLCYVAISMEELCDRFKQRGIFDKYYRDLRQFAWGQYTFVQKWTKSHGGGADACGDIDKVCFGLFPELAAFARGKFYVADCDGELHAALSKVLLTTDSFSKNADDANFVVKFKGNTDAKRLLEVARPKEALDKETLEWDLAEDIMERL